MYRGKWRGGSGGGGGGGGGTVTSVGTAADGSSGGSITTSGTITINGGSGISVDVSSAPQTDFTVSRSLSGAVNTGSSYVFPDDVDVLLADATLGSAGVLNVVIPSASSFSGRVISIKDDGSASASNTIVISASSGLIDSGTSYVLNSALQAIDLWAYNNNWWII